MEWLGALLFVLVLVACGVWAYQRYRQHARIAQQRSLSALNELLREADEIQQEKLRAEGIEPEQEPGQADENPA